MIRMGFGKNNQLIRSSKFLRYDEHIDNTQYFITFFIELTACLIFPTHKLE